MKTQQPNPDARAPLTRRGFLIACCAGAAGVVRANDRSPSPDADRLLVEWRTIAAGAASEHLRLKVFASGLVESWPAAGRSVACREQRSPEEALRLAAQLRELLGAEDVTTDKIAGELREQSRRTGLSFLIPQADDSLIRLSTDAGWIQVRCPAPPLLEERFPEAARLRAFARAERRLSNLGCIVQCGGQAAAEALCATANERLRAEHPDAKGWAVEDLMMVRISSGGSRFVQFRRGDDESGTWTTCVSETPGHAPRVTTIPPAGRLR
jgi:hypothetical protein